LEIVMKKPRLFLILLFLAALYGCGSQASLLDEHSAAAVVGTPAVA
jgi:hypothetical protein